MSARLMIPLCALLAGATGTASLAQVATCPRPVSAVPEPTAGNCYYDVVVHERTGAYSAGTGVEHPVTLEMISTPMGGRQTLALGAGRFLTPGARNVSIRSWHSSNDYRFDTLSFDTLRFDRGFTCVPAAELSPPLIGDIVRSDGQPIGLEARFDVGGGGDDLVVTIRLVARGEVFEDSAVELTTTIENLGGAEARLGVQYAWNVGMVGSGSAAFAPMPGHPPFELWVSREGEWTDPAFDHMLASVTNAPWMIEPYYLGGIAVNGPWPLDPPPTRPDAIVRGADWTGAPPGGPGNTCFAWEAPVPPRGGPPTPGGGGNESLVYYWGRTEDTAIRLAPGESRSFTTWFWALLDDPVTCDAGEHQVVECSGSPTPVQLDGSNSFTADGNPLQHRWSSSDPAVTFDDPAAARPTAFLPGVGAYPITLDVGIGPFIRTCTTEVEVVDTTPPVFRALTVEPATLWPPSHRLRDVHVEVAVEDACSASPAVRLVSAASNEPDDATGLGDGSTTGDIQGIELDADDRDVRLRAERDGNGAGRIYSLTYEASDESGNTSARVVLVSVPHDMVGGAARWLPRRVRIPRP
jgi:hypothetical protein